MAASSSLVAGAQPERRVAGTTNQARRRSGAPIMTHPVYRNAAGMRRAGDGTHEPQGHHRAVFLAASGQFRGHLLHNLYHWRRAASVGIFPGIRQAQCGGPSARGLDGPRDSFISASSALEPEDVLLHYDESSAELAGRGALRFAFESNVARISVRGGPPGLLHSTGRIGRPA